MVPFCGTALRRPQAIVAGLGRLANTNSLDAREPVTQVTKAGSRAGRSPGFQVGQNGRHSVGCIRSIHPHPWDQLASGWRCPHRRQSAFDATESADDAGTAGSRRRNPDGSAPTGAASATYFNGLSPRWRRRATQPGLPLRLEAQDRSAGDRSSGTQRFLSDGAAPE